MPGLFQRPRLAVQNGPFSADEDTNYAAPSVSFGADAEIARKTRELALSGFQSAMDSSRLAAEPAALKQQRGNISAHGTIESPFDFNRRTGTEGAADLMDPSNPMARLRGDEQRHAIERAELAPGGPRSTEIAGRNALEVGRQRGQFDREVADIEAGSREYGAEVEAGQRERGNVMDNLFGSMIPPEVAKDPRRRQEALNALYAEMRRMGLAGGGAAAAR